MSPSAPLVVPRLEESPQSPTDLDGAPAKQRSPTDDAESCSSSDPSRQVRSYGSRFEKVYVAIVDNAIATADFLRIAGRDCRPLERWMSKDLLYFVGEVADNIKADLKIRERFDFRQEIRRSRVLILSIKGKAGLSLEEARDVVNKSCLKDVMSEIELIAVNRKATKKAVTNVKTNVVHAYVQFTSEKTAVSMVNKVDAMPYRSWYVHSPQCDEHTFFFPDTPGSDAFIWRNPNVVNAPPAGSGAAKPATSSFEAKAADARAAEKTPAPEAAAAAAAAAAQNNAAAASVTQAASKLPYVYDPDMLYTLFN
ncbi:hypothetical protein DIPPA_16804 [Diplonema papillatum]|nr:hypothetical protein DIPPA_16804 [Diplonema papillatum]